MPKDLIRYDVLVQEALRGVVRKVLTEVSRAGLPGDHYFNISFSTRAPGVRISSTLRERFPDLITIVIQHQYWDLTVNETSFEVTLSFGGVPERLEVPFTAIRAFHDPAVEFGTMFNVELDETDEAKTVAADQVKAVEAAPSASEEPKAGSVVSLDAFRKKT